MGFYSDIKEKLFKRDLPEKSSAEYGSLYDRFDLERVMNAVNYHTEIERRVGKFGNRRQLEDMYFHDPEIFAAWDKRMSGLQSTQLEITGESETLVDFFKEQIVPHEYQLKEDFLWSIPYGYSVEQIIYNEDRSGAVSGFQRENFWRFDPLKDLRQVCLRSSGSLIEKVSNPGEVLPYGKWILTTNNGTSFNPAGEALFARLYLYWIFRCSDMDAWVRFVEKHGAGFLIGTAANKDDVKEMQKALDVAIKNASLSITEGDKVEVVKSPTNGEAYKIFDDQIVNTYLRVILGETQTSKIQEKGSSQSAGTHNEVRKEKILSDARLVEKSFNEAIFQIGLVNDFPVDQLPKAKLHMPQTLESGRADRDLKLKNIGVQFTPKYFIDNYGFKDDEIEGEIIAPGSENLPPVEASETTVKFNFEDKKPESRQLENGQDKIEEVISLLLRGDISPLNNDDLIAAVRASNSVDELQEKMASLFEQDNPQFSEEVAKALYHIGVIGAIDANKKG